MNDGVRVAVATTSALAAEAARETAEQGGNAVDCAVSAAMVAMNTQPGVCSLAGGGYVTVWPADGDPVTIDGGVAVPGKEKDRGYRPDDGVPLHMDYGGGVETVVGCASVGVPGALAACDRAASLYGRLPWSAILQPAIRAARDGFPLPSASHYYLEYSGRPIFSRSEDGERALYDDGGSLRGIGANIVVPGLADSLGEIAEAGASVFYDGPLGAAIVDHVRDGGGSLTRADLQRYDPFVRPALRTTLDDWSVALNPPPAVGGAVLASLLLLTRDGIADLAYGDAGITAKIIAAQRAALGYRRAHLDLSSDVGADAARMLELARAGELPGDFTSGATVHTSAVDESGLACSITSSSGYGSGEMPPGTGLWLNNCLGELELNRRGLAAGPPGTRLPSNMAPGVARCGDAILAFGSPGADRITTALQQFLLYHLLLGQTLEAANGLPRVHVEAGRDTPSVSAEHGVPLPVLDCPLRTYATNNMYFGGVGAARFDGGTRLSASADPRRVGGIYVSP